ncbi:MAG: GNAT family N-acetyltransferase [Candidatus Algichlamydia australiensis]|nr:GNAT family N-acetyltransferase [Chlamydiales bacterium]
MGTASVGSKVQFVNLNENCSQLFPLFKAGFERVVGDLYTNTADYLSRVERGRYECWLLQVEAEFVATVVHERGFIEEYRGATIPPKSIGIKTLIVFDPDKNRKKGYGTRLLDKVLEYARANLANGVHVTVSEKAESACGFFAKKGFEPLHVWENFELRAQGEEYLYYLNL